MNQTWEILATSGAVATALAVLAWLADRRRMRRKNLDKVGFMPWTSLFFWALFAAVMLLGLAEQAWLAS